MWIQITNEQARDDSSKEELPEMTRGKKENMRGTETVLLGLKGSVWASETLWSQQQVLGTNLQYPGQIIHKRKGETVFG